MAPFSKKDKILIKGLYERKGYNARQFVTEFPHKGWIKNSINRLLVKLRKSRTVWRVIFVTLVMQFRTNILISKTTLMNVLCINVWRLCGSNIMSLGVCFKKLHVAKVCAFAWYRIKIRVIFGLRFEKTKSWEKSTPTQKLKHANSILESFEYLSQMSLK